MGKDVHGPDNPAAGEPPRRSFAIAPNDGTDLTVYPTSIYVGVAGDVTALLAGDSGPGRLWKSVPAGTTLRGVFRRVFATGTTATNLIGAY